MAKSHEMRVRKSLADKVQELDDEQFLLRRDLHSLCDDAAHGRAIATRLRNLVCSSGRAPGSSVPNEGLLWRLARELDVSDEVELSACATLNPAHNLNTGLTYCKVPFSRGNPRPPNAPPPQIYSLREVFETCEAIYVARIQVDRAQTGVSARFTHERLIKAVAEQIGTAHVDEDIDLSLLRAVQPPIFGSRPLLETLAFDAELAIQIGERILDAAEAQGKYTRVPRARPNGELSIAVRLRRFRQLAGRLDLVTYRSYISEAEIHCFASPESVVFTPVKRGVELDDVAVPWPVQGGMDDAVFVLEYSSNRREALCLVNAQPIPSSPIPLDLGWLEHRELVTLDRTEDNLKAIHGFFDRGSSGSFPRLLCPRECEELLNDGERMSGAECQSRAAVGL